MMNDAQVMADRLFSKCFTPEERDYLQRDPRFVEATSTIETTFQALNAVELGADLVKQANRCAAQETSRLT